MKVLFTGFNGFNNTSQKIIDKITSDKILFNNSYKEIDDQLAKINIEDYDLIIMLGLRNNLKKSIRLEINSLLNNELLSTNLNYNELLKYFNSNNIPCIVNDKPTNYLCNYAYFKVLKRNKNAIFIHLPNPDCIKNLDKIIIRKKLKLMIGESIDVYIDRPIGSTHPKHKDIIYQVNYGYVKEIIAPDDEYQDAYVLGVNTPIECCKGVIYAVVERENDKEDKLIVVTDNKNYSEEEINEKINFQEKYFKYKILYLK